MNNGVTTKVEISHTSQHTVCVHFCRLRADECRHTAMYRSIAEKWLLQKFKAVVYVLQMSTFAPSKKFSIDHFQNPCFHLPINVSKQTLVRKVRSFIVSISLQPILPNSHEPRSRLRAPNGSDKRRRESATARWKTYRPGGDYEIEFCYAELVRGGGLELTFSVPVFSISTDMTNKFAPMPITKVSR